MKNPASTDSPLMERRLTLSQHMRWLLLVVVVLAGLIGGYAVFRVISSSRQASSAFQTTHCPFPLGAGLVEGHNVRCGFLVVPEDRNSPKSPTIRLAVAIFKTPNSQPNPYPVLFLGGGPGTAVLEEMGPGLTSENLAYRLQNRDLILLDQRGAGYSQPSLRCSDTETPQLCHNRLVKSGVNLNAYTTLENAADVHALIRALGYQQVNLYGVSYGTRLALTVMRLYPTDLHSVILDSVIPPQVNGFASMPPAALRAFDVLFQRCAADSSCNANYPHLQTVFYQLVSDLNTTPFTFNTFLRTGKSITVHFTGNDLVLWLQHSLYTTGFISQLPRAIFQIRQHDDTLLSQIYGNGISDTMSWGLFYSVMCSEDATFTTQSALRASFQGPPPQVQSALSNIGLSLFSSCQFWGMKPVPPLQKEPIRSTIPTLILQGEYDPVTPPSNGMLAAQTLSKSYFFLFPGVGHGVVNSDIGNCPTDIMNAFLVNPAKEPDASCITYMGEPFFA